jgi:trimeric autotransporter adhesin
MGGAPGAGQISVGATTGGTTVSFTGTDGDRQLTGIAAGSLENGSTDAVNGGQLNALATSTATTIGGGAAFDPLTGLMTAPTITVGGVAYDTVAAAIEAEDDRTTRAANGLADALGGGAGVGPDGTVMAPNYALGGNNYSNVGSALSALANGALGPVQYANASTPTLGNGGTPTNNLALVGSVAGPVVLDNVAAGSTAAGSTQAVNGGQLNYGLGSVAASLGGGATYDSVTGAVTAPTFSVAGGNFSTVGGALNGLDTAITGLTSGTAGLVQQTGGAPGAGAITFGAYTGGTVINVAGTDGNRTISGVAAGMITAVSTDAVNGAQLFGVQTTADGALQRSGGTMTGQIDMGGNRITNVAVPVAGTDAVNRDYVDGVAAAGSATTNALGQATAANLGGGAVYDPVTGAISAPRYIVGGVARNTVGDAIAATNRLGVQYVADAAGNPTNAVQLAGNGNGQPVALGNVAAGALTATSYDAVNGSQLYAVQQAAAGAVQYDRNTDGSLNQASVSFGTPGAPVQLRNVAPAIRSTDAVNLGQMQSALVSNLASAKAYTDGRFQEIAFDLRDVAQKAYAGTATAIALQSPALFDPGSFAMRGGAGFYRGEWALGLSFRATDDEGDWSLTGGVSGGPNSGVAASVGVDFLLFD